MCIDHLWTRLSDFFYINLLMPLVSQLCLIFNPMLTRLLHVSTLCGLEYHVSNVVLTLVLSLVPNINPLWTRLPYFLNNNLLMLEYHIPFLLSLCGLQYHM